MSQDKPKERFHQHKMNTRDRTDALGNKIEFKLSFEEWWTIWEESGHWQERGRCVGQYCMSRFNDIGHYEIGNVFIQLKCENSKTMIGRGTWTEEERENQIKSWNEERRDIARNRTNKRIREKNGRFQKKCNSV